MKKKLLALLLCVAMLLPSVAYAAPLGGINFSASAVKDLVSAAADEAEVEETPVEEEPVVETPVEEEKPVVEEIPTSESKDSLLGKISAATVKSLVDEVSVQATEDARAEDIYSQMMEANDLDSYGKISSTLNEIETTAFRAWLQENDLLAEFDNHINKFLLPSIRLRSFSTRQGSATPLDVADVSDALKLDKYATYNTATGKYDITLESYTTGVVEEGQILPADTVLVLDTSGSMAYDYKLLQIGTPMYGDFFAHPSGNYWGWYENGHLVNGKNPYVLLPDGTFAEAEYFTTDANSVEVFRVKGTNTLFYPTMQTEGVMQTPRVYNYPVYTLYSSTAPRTITINTGVPQFGDEFTYNGITYYGWLGNSHGEPYVRLEDGTFIRAYYSRTDSKNVEIFKVTDTDTNTTHEFYPQLTERCKGITRVEDLPVVQLYSGYTTMRMAALHDAVAEFLRLTAEKNNGIAANLQSRVALVQFSCDVHGGPAPTKILRNLTAINESNVDEWISFVYGITDGGGSTHTEIGEGMLLAEDILEGITRVSHKAVIAFTDGKPECDATSGGGFSYIETEKAIAAANRMTVEFDADIYSICIQDHAAVNAGAALPPDEGKGVNDDKNNINRFMHLMSSNYPQATSMSNTGTGSTNGGYYMVPGGEDDLVDIFTSIGDQIGSASINLGGSAVVVDYVTPYFQVPADTTINIAVKDAYYESGALKWKDSTMDISDISYTVDASDRTVKITGFDYNHNFVAEQGRVEGNIAALGSFHGRKLVITFPVSENADFLGGDDVVTNEGESGIYHEGSLVAKYPVPDVNVPVKTITPAFQDTKIYVSQAAELPHIANIGNFSVGGTAYQIDGINNDYVTITYTISDGTDSMSYTVPAGTKFNELDVNNEAKWTKSSNNISIAKVLENDTTYTVTCDVVSTNNADNKSQAVGYPKVDVYKPRVTFEDSVIRWGEAADYADNYVSVVWKHGDDVASVQEMGGAPTLSYTYDVAAGEFHADTPVKVTKVTALNNMDVTSHTTFNREACTFSDCNHGGSTGVGSLNPNFIVHLLRFDLVIGKTGIEEVDHHAEKTDVTNAEWQSTIFTVYNEQTGVNMDVTIHGNGTVKILDLPAATTAYTVTEKTDWSWRYDPEGSVTKTVELVTTDGETEEVNFKNNRTATKWLNGGFWVKNVFDGIGQ